MATPSSVFLRQKKSEHPHSPRLPFGRRGEICMRPHLQVLDRSQSSDSQSILWFLGIGWQPWRERKNRAVIDESIRSFLLSFFAARRSQMDVLANTGVVTKIAPLLCHCSFPSCLSFNFPFQLLENEREEGAKTSKWDQFFREVNYGFWTFLLFFFAPLCLMALEFARSQMRQSLKSAWEINVLPKPGKGERAQFRIRFPAPPGVRFVNSLLQGCVICSHEISIIRLLQYYDSYSLYFFDGMSVLIFGRLCFSVIAVFVFVRKRKKTGLELIFFLAQS